MQYLLTVEVDEDGTPSVELREYTEGELVEAHRAVAAQKRAEKAAAKAKAAAEAAAKAAAAAEAKRLEQEAREELARLAEVAVKTVDLAVLNGRGASYVQISEANSRVHAATQFIRKALGHAAHNGLLAPPELVAAERRLVPLKAELGIRS
jgi:sRNA-binding protein